MKRLTLMLAGLALLGAGCGTTPAAPETNLTALTLPSGRVVHVDLAVTRSEQARGLSGREDIGEGMLFCFSQAKQQNFWMSGMEVPIDMIWILDDEVEGVAANVPIREDGDWARRSSVGPVNAVLELPAGWSERELVEGGSMIEGITQACGEVI